VAATEILALAQRLLDLDHEAMQKHPVGSRGKFAENKRHGKMRV
jgi:hypothetical protein